MKRPAGMVALAGILAFASLGLLVQADDSASPAVLRVLQMLTDLQGDVIKEGKDAAQVFDTQKQLCSTRSKELRASYSDRKAQKEKLDADIAQAKVEIETMNSKIEDLMMSIAGDELDLKEASKLRKEDEGIFQEQQKDIAGTVDALDRALAFVGHEQRKSYKSDALVQMEAGGREVAEALKVVVEASTLSAADQSKLSALLQTSQAAGRQSAEDAEDAALDSALDTQVASRTSDAAGLVTLLNEILEKAQSELESLRSEETHKLHSFEALRQSIENKMKYRQRDVENSQSRKNDASKRKAGAEEDLALALKNMKDDEAMLRDLQKSCITKASKYENDVQARADEVNALSQAKKIISEKLAPPSPSFLQVKRVSQAVSDDDQTAAASAAARSVRRLAVRMNSPVLIELAGRLDYVSKGSSGMRYGAADPLKKVRSMVEGMISTLEHQDRADAEHDSFCKKEMSAAAIKRDDRQDDVDKYTTQIDQGRSAVARLAEEISALRKELSEIADTQLKMVKVRNEEKEAHTKEIKIHSDGIDALKMALQVLRVFYTKIGDPSGRGKKVFSILEYTQSGLHKSVILLQAEEKEAQNDHQKIMKENDLMKAAKEKEVNLRMQQTTKLQKAISELSADNAAANEELDALKDYLEKLKNQCIAKPEPFEERQQRRKKEIQGLKEALAALDGSSQLQVEARSTPNINTVFLQLRGSHGH
eukprot:TRINITY_DN63294_c0_g1_i1.p1 TRINITY_DN63294_c0_g1~~TRINITY_DN63294_c0_g1_i1.p1  ORF type:complete len:709 (-),score=196.15 TRINITY_DN63294_c0_g1_i1:132-2258(-)